MVHAHSPTFSLCVLHNTFQAASVCVYAQYSIQVDNSGQAAGHTLTLPVRSRQVIDLLLASTRGKWTHVGTTVTALCQSTIPAKWNDIPDIPLEKPVQSSGMQRERKGRDNGCLLRVATGNTSTHIQGSRTGCWSCVCVREQRLVNIVTNTNCPASECHRQ